MSFGSLEPLQVGYTNAQLLAWKSDPRTLLPDWHPDIGRRGETYGFGEALVLRHHVDMGWDGAFPCTFFETECSNSEKHQFAFKKVAAVLGRERLLKLQERFMTARLVGPGGRRMRGKPDLFLFCGPRELKFVEVKRKERVEDHQRDCVRLIEDVLGPCVQIFQVRLRE